MSMIVPPCGVRCDRREVGCHGSCAAWARYEAQRNAEYERVAKAVQDTNSTMLVYGWKLIDQAIPDRGDARLLLAPISQTNSSQQISELRLLTGTDDRRFALPESCVGAMVRGQSIYAFSGSYLYRSDVNNQRFYAYALPLPEGESITAYLGELTGGKVLLASGETVYAVTLPQ